MKNLLLPVLAATLYIAPPALAQQTITPATGMSNPKTELRYNLSEDGSKYIKATFLNQVWLRWTDNNSGTTINGKPQDNTLDIGLRRTRLQLFGQLTDHVFFYTQFGMNNFNRLAQMSGNRKLQAFFHDALAEYKVFKGDDRLKLGGGLTILSGLSRFSQPSVGTIMTTDVPVFAQATVDQTDEFGRKLSVYARGQVGKLDYRVALSDHFPVQTNGLVAPEIGKRATFAKVGLNKQYQGFFIYNLLEKEPHTTPYMAGTYLGDKKILNIEGGLIYQKDATWYTPNGTDTTYADMLLWSLAAFADMPLQDNTYALSAYAGYFNTHYGNDYIRNNGIMNPATGTTDPSNFNGAGNAYPMFGTGETIYTQVGLRLPENLLGEMGTLMPYASFRHSSYSALAAPVDVWNYGINWLLDKHKAKVSLNNEIRPEFEIRPDGEPVKASTRASTYLQFQIYF